MICLDLKGYGWSAAPKGDAAHEAYSKRQMGREVVAVMERMGHVRFGLVGHDRGARVGYRLALDEPGRIERLALLDILPTISQWQKMDREPEAYPHWRFLAQPAPIPEQEIGQAPIPYYEDLLRIWTGSGTLDAFSPGALDLYRQSWNVPERIHASCEDYRAGAGPDRAADEADLAGAPPRRAGAGAGRRPLRRPQRARPGAPGLDRHLRAGGHHLRDCPVGPFRRRGEPAGDADQSGEFPGPLNSGCPTSRETRAERVTAPRPGP